MSANEEVVEVSKETMLAFIDLRDEGTYNMLDPMVREELGITKKEHWYICSHFDELCKQYNIDC